MFLEQIITTAHNSISRYPIALDYLRSRLVTDNQIKDFKIGYGKVLRIPEVAFPDKERFMAETFRGRKLENRILFPFQDPIGRVIGLAGRSIETKEFKTFVSDEGKYMGFFFGLYQALPHIYTTKRVYVVEGYFDLLAFSKVYPNTVATITSGMSEAQYELLCFFCDDIVTCFDSDEAGDLGRKKASQWKNVREIQLGYKDPAKCLETLHLNAFKSFVSKKVMEIAPF
jgi:DNA primase